ncbi:MAG: hypothetical protein ACYTHJ_15145 [Planctomycetota bacterium]
MRRSVRLSISWFSCVAGACVVGACVPPDQPIRPGPTIPLDDAVKIVNNNVDRIQGALRAVGVIDGEYADDRGRVTRFSLDATLFFLEPLCLRMEMKKLGNRQLLAGSNLTNYWVDNRIEERLDCGRHGDRNERMLPIQPRKLLDALGLSRISRGLARPGEVAQIQRVHGDFQQLIFIEEDRTRQRKIAKEYWLDRFAPRLIGKVVFRDSEGRLEMESSLGDYRPLDDDGPVLPHLMEVTWRNPPSSIKFKIRKWSMHEGIDAESKQFATHPDCNRP